MGRVGWKEAEGSGRVDGIGGSGLHNWKRGETLQSGSN